MQGPNGSNNAKEIKTYAEIFYEMRPELDDDWEEHLLYCRSIEFLDSADCGHAQRDWQECQKCWEEPYLRGEAK